MTKLPIFVYLSPYFGNNTKYFKNIYCLYIYMCGWIFGVMIAMVEIYTKRYTFKFSISFGNLSLYRKDNILRNIFFFLIFYRLKENKKIKIKEKLDKKITVPLFLLSTFILVYILCIVDFSYHCLSLLKKMFKRYKCKM